MWRETRIRSEIIKKIFLFVRSKRMLKILILQCKYKIVRLSNRKVYLWLNSLYGWRESFIHVWKIQYDLVVSSIGCNGRRRTVGRQQPLPEHRRLLCPEQRLPRRRKRLPTSGPLSSTGDCVRGTCLSLSLSFKHQYWFIDN